MTSTNRTFALGLGVLVLAGVAAASWVAFGRDAHAAPAVASPSPAGAALVAATPSPTPGAAGPVASPSPAATSRPLLPPPGRNLLCAEVDDFATAVAGPDSDAWATLQALRARPTPRPLLLALVSNGSSDELVAVDGATGTPTTLAEGIRLSGTIPRGGTGDTLRWAPNGSGVLIGVSGGCNRTAVYAWSAAGISRLDRFIADLKPGIDVAWSPDGGAVATYEEAASPIRPPPRFVGIVQPDGTPMLTLQPLPCDDCAPIGPIGWSPDGRWISAAYQEYGPSGERAAGVALACMSDACAASPGTRAWKLVLLAHANPLGWRNGHELVATATVGGHRRVVAIDPDALPRKQMRVIATGASNILGAIPGDRLLVADPERLGPDGYRTVLAVRDVKTGRDRLLWRPGLRVGVGFELLGASGDGSLVAVSNVFRPGGPGPQLWLVSTVARRQVMVATGRILAATWVPPLP